MYESLVLVELLPALRHLCKPMARSGHIHSVKNQHMLCTEVCDLVRRIQPCQRLVQLNTTALLCKHEVSASNGPVCADFQTAGYI